MNVYALTALDKGLDHEREAASRKARELSNYPASKSRSAL